MRILVLFITLFVLWTLLTYSVDSRDLVAGFIVSAIVAVVLWHARVIRLREMDERAVVFYERGLERLEDRWTGQGNPGEAYLDADHAYASDLDLFGRGSLFELICTARTGPGEATLARHRANVGGTAGAGARPQSRHGDRSHCGGEGQRPEVTFGSHEAAPR